MNPNLFQKYALTKITLNGSVMVWESIDNEEI